MPRKKETETPGRQALKAQRTRDGLINSTISLIKEGGFLASKEQKAAI